MYILIQISYEFEWKKLFLEYFEHHYFMFMCTVLKIIMQLFYKALNCVKQKTCTKTNAHWFDRKMFWEASHVDTQDIKLWYNCIFNTIQNKKSVSWKHEEMFLWTFYNETKRISKF